MFYRRRRLQKSDIRRAVAKAELYSELDVLIAFIQATLDFHFKVIWHPRKVEFTFHKYPYYISFSTRQECLIFLKQTKKFLDAARWQQRSGLIASPPCHPYWATHNESERLIRMVIGIVFKAVDDYIEINYPEFERGDAYLHLASSNDAEDPGDDMDDKDIIVFDGIQDLRNFLAYMKGFIEAAHIQQSSRIPLKFVDRVAFYPLT